MRTSGGKKFFKLYAKEMWDLRPEIFTVIAAALLLDILLYYNSQRIFNLLWVMVVGLAAFLPFISSFKLLGQEWNFNTVYLLMSLPVRGASILGSKLLALLSQYIIGMAAVSISGIILAWALFPEPGLLEIWRQVVNAARVQDILGLGLLYFLTTLAGMAYVICISFFSQLAGKLVKRFSGLVTAGVFVATFWLIGKAMFPLWQSNFINIESFTQVLGISALIMLAGTVIVFIAAVLVYDHKIEL